MGTRGAGNPDILNNITRMVQNQQSAPPIVANQRVRELADQTMFNQPSLGQPAPNNQLEDMQTWLYRPRPPGVPETPVGKSIPDYAGGLGYSAPTDLAAPAAPAAPTGMPSRQGGPKKRSSGRGF